MPVPGVIQRLRGVDYQTSRTFFVTLCVRDRRRAFDDAGTARRAQDIILKYRAAGWYYLLCYCIMPDHIHLLIRLRSSQRSLSRVVVSLKNKIRYATHGLVEWQYGYHDHVLRPYESVRLFVRYILANPVRAALVRDTGDYPFGGIVDPWF